MLPRHEGIITHNAYRVKWLTGCQLVWNVKAIFRMLLVQDVSAYRGR